MKRAGHRHDLVVVEAAHHHGVDLHRAQVRCQRDVNATQHPVERVAAGDSLEAVAAQRVEGDVRPPQARLLERSGEAVHQEAVGGDRQLHAELAEGGDHVDQVTAQGRLAAGDADGPHPQLDRDPQRPDHLVAVEHLAAPEPRQAVLRHAVEAAEVAAVGDRHAQVAHDPPETVHHHAIRLGHGEPPQPRGPPMDQEHRGRAQSRRRGLGCRPSGRRHPSAPSSRSAR